MSEQTQERLSRFANLVQPWYDCPLGRPTEPTMSIGTIRATSWVGSPLSRPRYPHINDPRITFDDLRRHLTRGKGRAFCSFEVWPDLPETEYLYDW